METPLVNMEETTTKAGRGAEKMRWDMTTTDKLLYLVNSIVLLVCGVVLMFIIKPLDAPHKSINCYSPKEFPIQWSQFTERFCLSPDAKWYKIPEKNGDSSQLFLNQTIEQDKIFPTREANPDFTSSLFLMSILSLLPIICWRLVGSFDGRDFVTNEKTSTRNGFIVMLWFLITKVCTAALCALFVVLIFGMKGQGDEYLDVVKYNRQPEDQAVLCDFWIRRLGSNLHKYTVSCIVTKGQYDVSTIFGLQHILDSVLKSLQIWLIAVMAVNVINLLATAIFILSLSSRSSRINFIQKYIPEETDNATSDKIDRRLGFSGAIVFNLAIRQGHGERVNDALSELTYHED